MSLFRPTPLISVIKDEIYDAQRMLMQVEAKAEEMRATVDMYNNRLARLKRLLAEMDDTARNVGVKLPQPEPNTFG